MPNIDQFIDEIDGNRVRRVRELSAMKNRFSSEPDSLGIGSKSVIVLAYAHWEGFYNDCVKSYINFLRGKTGKMRESDWMMLSGALVSEFQSLRDKGHSHEARRVFVNKMRLALDCGYDQFNSTVVLARSNLDFDKLRGNYEILNFDISKLQVHRIRIDREIVGWRHLVAHGDQPDLSALNIAHHIDLVSELLLILADQFQDGMLFRLDTGPAG